MTSFTDSKKQVEKEKIVFFVFLLGVALINVLYYREGIEYIFPLKS